MDKKYYEYYEDIYSAVLATDGDRFNSLPVSDFGDLFERQWLPQTGKVLDLGCGEGLYSVVLAHEGYTVHGVDISVSAIALARQRAAAQKLTHVSFSVGDITKLDDQASETFDIVLSLHCYHCLSDVQDRLTHLRQAWRVLRTGGVFVFENMAVPLDADLSAFREWHRKQAGQSNAQITEDETGIATKMDSTQPFFHKSKSTGKEIKISIAVAMAHRFYSRLDHVIGQLQELRFEILSAKTTVPDRVSLGKPEPVHGDNIIYARKR